MFEDKISKFELFINDLEKNNQSLFNGQLDRSSRDKPAKFINEIVLHLTPPLSIGFFKDTFLPKNLQDEATQAFISIFSDK